MSLQTIGHIVASLLWMSLFGYTILKTFNAIYQASALLTSHELITTYVYNKISHQMRVDSIMAACGWAIIIVFFFN